MHAGTRPDGATGARITPCIKQRHLLLMMQTMQLALYDLQEPGNVYGRLV